MRITWSFLSPVNTMSSQCGEYLIRPIGRVLSWYHVRNATPRQANICPQSRACIELNHDWFDRPSLAVQDLDQFSHLWILFQFNQNEHKHLHARVKPPRMDGKSSGVFATRSPHRPNGIGLSLVKMDRVEDNRVFVTGVDMLNNTPVLDIKPYIGDYDCPQHLDRDAESTCPDWIKRHGVQPKTIKDESNRVRFTDRSLRQLQQFHSAAGGQHSSEHLLNGRPVCNTYLNHKQTKRTSVEDDQNNEKSAGSSSHSLAEAQPDDDLCVRHMKCLYCLGFLNQWSEAARAIECILMEDPRSTYRRKSCNDRLYYFTVDTMHITCWFDPDDQTVEVLKVRPNYILL